MTGPDRSLFGGEIPDPSALISHLFDDEFPAELTALPPHTPLPSTEFSALFGAAWDRFHLLKDIGQAAGGRWRSGQRPTPRHVPTVISSFFGVQVANTFRVMQNMVYDRVDETGTAAISHDLLNMFPLGPIAHAWAGLTATPYLLDADLTGAILASEPPTPDVLADLRLPGHRTLVLLGAPYLVDRDSGWWTDDDLERAAAGDEMAKGLLDAFDAPRTGDFMDLRRDSFSQTFYSHGGRIHGALLFADDHGFLDDQIAWLVETDDDHPDGGMMTTINGRITASVLEPLVHNLAAAVAWAPWQPPNPELVARMPATRAELEPILNKGSFRRLIRRDDAHGVHVIDADRTRQPRTGPDEPTGRTVSPHLRRGHWRSVRIAERDPAGTIIGDVHGTRGTDWHYEGRWVPPTYVNADRAAATTRVTVYRVPDRSVFDADTP